jgi:hypothetical protein
MTFLFTPASHKLTFTSERSFSQSWQEREYMRNASLLAPREAAWAVWVVSCFFEKYEA